MKILTHVPSVASTTIQSVLPARAALVPAPCVPAIARALATREYDLLLFDPVTIREAAFRCLLDELSPLRHPILWYTSLGAERQLLDAAEAGFGDFVLRGLENSRISFADRLSRARSGCATALLLELTAARLRRVPKAARLVIFEMLAGGPTVISVRELAALANIPRRSLDRSIQRAGFNSGRRLVAALRTAIYWDEFCTVAPLSRSGARPKPPSCARGVIRTYRLAIGLKPSAAAVELSNADVARLLRSYLDRPAILPSRLMKHSQGLSNVAPVLDDVIA
jgi:hypothetical protein